MKPREKIILALFVITLLGSVFVIGSDLYKKKRQDILDRRWAVELRLAEMETLIDEESSWEDRGNWLTTHQPKFESRDAIDNHIFSVVKQAPEGVTVPKVQLIEAAKTDHWVQAGVQVTAKGTLENIFRWLYQLQSPENFFVIDSLRVLPDKKELDVILCEFKLVRWYAPQ